jgi:hypothetical protein
MKSKISLKRWKRLRYHPEQTRLWTENRRFAVVAAGRRSGKTELAKRRLVLALKKKKVFYDDARYFAAAPTRGQAKRIFWADLKALVPAGWVKRVYETDLCIVTRFKSELWVAGLDKPQRIEGTPWDGAVLDEYADMKPTVWSECIRPALSDRRGWCWFIGVPEGFNHYKDLADYAKRGVDPDWGFYSWPSADILPEEEVEAARRILDPRTFRQEYEASFEGATGRVYYAYDRIKHEDAKVTLDASRPIIVCADFNVSPCVWVLAQTDGISIGVFDEIVLYNTNTVEMAGLLRERYGSHGAGFVVYGDAAGSARSTAGASDYALMAEMGFTNQRVPKANPAVKDRVNAVNAMLENTRGESRFFHHPRCQTLRRDFETVAWDASGSAINKGDPDRTHASDALGYYVASEFRLGRKKPNPAMRFYK